MAPPATGTSTVSVRHAASSSSAAFASAPLPASDQDEACPVCKTTRYFNRDMEFRINTECYHRMCKTCVERIFKDGPNQCPYAGCHKTLRLRGFKTAFFSDLAIEREVDIRRRVAAVFNKAEDDFETLDAYNDYLYMVECLTEDLVGGGDEARRAAEARLAEWEAQHRAEIERNRRLARESDEARLKRVAGEQEAARQRRLKDLREEAEERVSAARFREEMLDSLQTAELGHAAETVDKVLLKKRGQQRRDAADVHLSSAGLSIRGLRDKRAAAAAAAAADDRPYDPFGGLDLAPRRVDLAKDRLPLYSSEWLDMTRTKHDFVVGGYSPDEYLSRALFEAFSGLGVFVAQDKDQEASALATTAAAQVAGQTGQTTGQMDVDSPT